ncbi:MAG: prephenate dehydratase [Solirubrobacterales bacterium]|nr:prephenate dehydratase [Solirubrobacterales bacterium]
MRIAYLGPAGTFSEDALRQSGFASDDAIPVLCEEIPEAVESIGRGGAERALVPIENSIEGSVRSTLDSLVDQADSVTILGEYDHPIRSALIARTELEPGQIEAVLSHPQPLAQCARFLRTELPGAELRVATSTSSAVREVSGSERPLAALAPAAAAGIYGCVVLREGIEDEPGNVTRFIWLGPRDERDAGPPDDGPPDGAVWKTTLVFSELGADHPGALVDALLEFSQRQINLVRIESRPLRRVLGRYRFFIDIEGREGERGVAEAIEALRTKADSVQILGSYRGAATDPAGPGPAPSA